MKKVLIATTIVLVLVIVVLASVIAGTMVPKDSLPGFLGNKTAVKEGAQPAGQPAAQPAGQPGQQKLLTPQEAAKTMDLPDKKPSQYKIGIPMEKAIKAKKPFVVLFYADWCPHCRAFMPKFEILSQLYAGKYNFVMINAESPKNAPYVNDYAIGAFPTVFTVDPKTGARSMINNTIYGSIDRMSAELDRFIGTGGR